MTAIFVVLIIIVAVVVAAAASSVRILREYERAVVFRLGRLLGQKGPGIVVLIPGVDRMVRVDLRTVTFDIPPQDLITRDNVPAKVNAVTYFQVVDPIRAVVKVERYRAATSQIAQTTLRSVLGKADLDMLLSERERLNEALQQIIDEQTDPWGIKVTTVEIKDVGIPQGMQRAMARQAEAERERRAKAAGGGAPREGHQRRGRVPGLRAPLRRGADHEREPDRAPAALPADAPRAGLEPGVDDRLPAPDRPAQAAAPGDAVRRHREAPAPQAGRRRGERGTDARDRQRRPRARRALDDRQGRHGRRRGAGRAGPGPARAHRGRAPRVKPGRPRAVRPAARRR